MEKLQLVCIRGDFCLEHMTGNDFKRNVFFTIWIKFYDFKDFIEKNK